MSDSTSSRDHDTRPNSLLALPRCQRYPNEPSRRRADDFAWIPAQTTMLGSDAHYPEEAPAREVTVDGFWMQRHQVTNAQFAAFVDATGYVTVAERPLNPDDYPGAPAENLQPGSMVFHRTAGPGRPAAHQPVVDLDAGRVLEPPPRARVRRCAAASTTPSCTSRSKTLRRTPSGPALGAADRGAVGGRRPRRPARGDLHLGRRAGARRAAAGQLLARRVPVSARHGLRVDAAGGLASPPTATGCTTWRATSGSGRPTGGRTTPPSNHAAPQTVTTPAQPQFQIGRKVVKGGSFLCADSYCLRYRPAARRPQMVDTGMSHIGFRCVRRE